MCTVSRVRQGSSAERDELMQNKGSSAELASHGSYQESKEHIFFSATLLSL